MEVQQHPTTEARLLELARKFRDLGTLHMHAQIACVDAEAAYNKAEKELNELRGQVEEARNRLYYAALSLPVE